MGTATAKRIVAGLALALAFGVVWSVAKGNGGGFRDAAGNVSAPWLILPLLAAGFVTPRPALGAALGLAVTLLALIAFYLTNAFVLDLGPHGTLQDIALTMRAAGNLWFRYGVLSGIGFGAIGAWLAGRQSRPAIGVIVAALLICEPGAVAGGHLVRDGTLSGFAVDPVVSAAELCCGLTLATTLYLKRRWQR